MKQLLIYNKLNELSKLIDDNELKILINKYKIDINIFENNNEFNTCKICGITKEIDDFHHMETSGYFGSNKYQKRKHLTDECIQCRDKRIAKMGLKKSIRSFIIPLIEEKCDGRIYPEYYTDHDNNCESQKVFNNFMNHSNNVLTDDILEFKVLIKKLSNKLISIKGSDKYTI